MICCGRRSIGRWLDYVQTNVAGKITSDDLPKAFKPESTVLNENELRHLLAEARSPTFLAKKRGTSRRFPGSIRRWSLRPTPGPGAAKSWLRVGPIST